MAAHQTPAHLKAEMPQIPGVAGPRKPAPNPMLPLIIGLVVIGIILLFAVRWLSRNKVIEPARAEQAPQLEIPPPPPDPASLLPPRHGIRPGDCKLSLTFPSPGPQRTSSSAIA